MPNWSRGVTVAAVLLALISGCTSRPADRPVASARKYGDTPLYPGGDPPWQFGPKAVCYASAFGVVADGKTDNTARIQAVLDRYGAAGVPLEYVIDQSGITLVSGTIYLWSHQTLRGVAGATLMKAGIGQGTDGWAVVSNKHPVTYPTVATDQYITIRDLYIDGNRRNDSSGTATPGVTPQGWTAITVGLYGVSHFLCENVHVYDSSAYGFAASSSSHGLILGCSRTGLATDQGNFDSGVQLNGGCDDIHIIGFYGQANDDGFAFNPSSLDLPDNGYKPGTNAQAPITHCSVRDSRFDRLAPNWQGNLGRMLSANSTAYLKDIVISGISGTGCFHAIVMDTYGLGTTSWYDGITIEDVAAELDTMTTQDSPTPGLVYINQATIGRIQVRGCTARMLNAASNLTSIITTTSQTSINSIVIDDLYFEDTNGYSAVPVVTLAGSINTAEIRGLVTNRGTQSTLAQPAINCTGTVNRVRAISGHIDRYSNVINVTAGTTSVVNAVGVSHTNAGGSKSFTSSGSGALTTLNQSANDSASVGP